MFSNFAFHFGRYLDLLWDSFSRPERLKIYWRETLRQMDDIGVGSLIIVAIIAVFMGAVAAVQFAYQLDGQLVPSYYIGYIVRDLAIIESAPTITCLVLAGKVGSNMASEIGGMRQKEHIDAMEIMGVNTAAFLILPKIIAAMIMIPLLVALAAGLAIVGGYMAVVIPETIPSSAYIKGLQSFFVPYNVFIMFVKAFIFAFILTTVSCYKGYYVEGGSVELGAASTQAVVVSDILILLADFLIAVVLTG
jgi:phospholipid/cholesterol/gamma-HCH transport system permease protein